MSGAGEAREPNFGGEALEVEAAFDTPRLRRQSTIMDFEPGLVQLQRKSFVSGQDSEVGRTSTMATAMNIVTVMVGAGVLGFPKVFGLAGWYAGPAVLLASAVSAMELGLAMDESIELCHARLQAGERFSFARLEKYEDMVEVAFGSQGKAVASVVMNTFMLLLCGAYMILIGNSMQFLTNKVLPYRGGVLVTSVLFAGLCLLRDMEVISRLSVVGVIASAVYVVAIAQAGLTAGFCNRSQEWFETRNLPDYPADIGKVLSVMFFGFAYQYVVPSLRSEMAVPRELPQAIKQAVFVVSLVYVLASMTGYWGWGNSVEGDVLRSMVDPEGNRMFAGVGLSTAVICNLLVTFPIIMNIVAVAVEARRGGEFSAPLRLKLLGVTVFVGLFCPFFLEVLSLIASTLGTVILTFLPLAVYWKLNLARGQRPSTLVCIKHLIIAFLGVTAALFGTWSAVEDLGRAMQRPGANPIGNFWKPD